MVAQQNSKVGRPQRGRRRLHSGTLFVWLFFALAPAFAIVLFIRSIRRALGEPQRLWLVAAVGAAALGIWALATYFMGLTTFGVAWGLAHAEPLPPRPFPEGWQIYALLGAYAGLGICLLVALARVPRRTAA